MKTIYKYKLQFTGEQDVFFPDGADILSLQVQNDEVVLWAVIDTDASSIPAKIRMFGTGEIIPDSLMLKHIGTVQIGSFVRHFFLDYTVHGIPFHFNITKQ